MADRFFNTKNHGDLGTPQESRLRTNLWCLIVGLLIAIGGLALWHPAQVGKTLVYAASALTAPIQPIIRQFPLAQFGTLSEPTSILFMGTDVVYTGAVRKSADHTSLHGNSDTMMLVFLNPSQNTISVLNIPRDTEAYVGTTIRKINSANVIGGPELARQTVSSLLNVPVNHYVDMNIQGLVDIVNELGGITVDIPKKMSYMDWTAKLKIDLQPGAHTLTGNQAMGFVRFRHDALGDVGRVQRQQIFLSAALKKMLDPASWLHLNACMDIAHRNIETDMSNQDIFAALNFIHSVPRDSTKFVMLPGQFASNGDWIANTDARDIAQRLANPDQESVRNRRNITVCIVNATSDRLFGGKLAKSLRKLGYNVFVGKDENDPASKKTKVIAQIGNTAEARMMQHDLGQTGEIVNASTGNLLAAITIVAHEDINLNKVELSSADAPYVTPISAKPLVSRLSLVSPPRSKRGGQPMPPAVQTVPAQSDENQNPDVPVGDANSNSETDNKQPAAPANSNSETDNKQPAASANQDKSETSEGTEQPNSSASETSQLHDSSVDSPKPQTPEP